MAISSNIKNSMTRSSWIREMFEKGQQLKEKHGADQVFDFSIGNPTMEPPPKVHEEMIRILQENKNGNHRYMQNVGYAETREYIANEQKETSGFDFHMNDIVMCVGAGGGLNALFKALLDPGEEIMALAPYFVEYGAYVQNHGGALTIAKTNVNFQIDLQEIEKTLTSKTKAIIINSPNNPTGVVYSQNSLDELGKLLVQKEKEYGHGIFLISDEPYRKIIFDGLTNCDVFKSHINSIMITSHSKDLALAGERIGFIAIHPEMADRIDLQNALAVTTRILGFVNAPALMQHVLPRLKGVNVSISEYQHLRDIFYKALTDMGFEMIYPQGAFYLFPKSPIPDDVEFVKKAQEENLLFVPGSGFGSPGYFRISFCYPKEMIVRSFPSFQKIAEKFRLIS